jgi:hypothetical protein
MTEPGRSAQYAEMSARPTSGASIPVSPRRWRSRLALACVLSVVGSSSGCADRYFLSEPVLDNLASFPRESRAHIALPAVRERGRRSTWVHADRLLLDGPRSPTGVRLADEVPTRQRVSKVGVALAVVGALGLIATGYIGATYSSCGQPGGAPCLGSGGDVAIPVSLAGAALLFTGTGLALARALDLHPAEVTPKDQGLLILGNPIETNPTGKTSIE